MRVRESREKAGVRWREDGWMKAEGECGQSLPRRRGGPVINIPYPLCLGLPLRHDTGAPYLGKTLLLLIHPPPIPCPLRGEPSRNP